jgi:hypothetical protein
VWIFSIKIMHVNLNLKTILRAHFWQPNGQSTFLRSISINLYLGLCRIVMAMIYLFIQILVVKLKIMDGGQSGVEHPGSWTWVYLDMINLGLGLKMRECHKSGKIRINLKKKVYWLNYSTGHTLINKIMNDNYNTIINNKNKSIISSLE